MDQDQIGLEDQDQMGPEDQDQMDLEDQDQMGPEDQDQVDLEEDPDQDLGWSFEHVFLFLEFITLNEIFKVPK